MSEIYRLEKEGTIAKLPKGAECDYITNPAVDDCRGEMCGNCRRFQEEQAEAKEGES